MQNYKPHPDDRDKIEGKIVSCSGKLWRQCKESK